jgi:tetratricopeptide (TPR) repeat protein
MMPAPLNADPDARAALREAMDALDLAQASGLAWAVAEAHLGLARHYRQLGEPGFALTLLLQGLAAAQGADQRVELLCYCIGTLAEHAEQLEASHPSAASAARDSAREHIAEAGRLAARVADPHWEVKVLLHLSDVLDRFGDHDDALQLQHRAMRLMQRPGSRSAADPLQLASLGRLADG